MLFFGDRVRPSISLIFDSSDRPRQSDLHQESVHTVTIRASNYNVLLPLKLMAFFDTTLTISSIGLALAAFRQSVAFFEPIRPADLYKAKDPITKPTSASQSSELRG